MRTTVTLKSDVAEAERELMRASGKTLGQVLSQLAKRGLPTFRVTASAPVIPSDRAAELLADERG